ncbi:nucleic acid-binding protein [Aspergillus heteromorphus CBS 117.55]|uniref:Nucleic acid-binding protein n=1 Tax=Aspergillus heteromorphus CBS 117.55 TaxID=1448321 RepID=A0A317WRQ4_9EURO|nr:nucleic acid-binding protein [Aspergillus heteromorphus CBS 117.55]PWY88411.1 nucleic acid-binding protein [Aspergillus heteromorphus CBS 117.55]
MRPSTLLRALQPLRSSMIRTTTRTAAPQHHHHNPRQQQQQQQEEKEESEQSQRPLSGALPPSLRKYPYTSKIGTVTTVGRMNRTVRVSHRHSVWDSYIQKYYPKETTFLVSDPRDSLREGDVIEFSSGYPKSRTVRHVVDRIIAPFGSPVESRPPVMSRAERDAEREAKRAAKFERREARRLESGQVDAPPKEHVGRIRRLVLERTQ